MSSFFSGKKSPGKNIGGREADLSHITPKDLTKALEQFDAGYRELQRKAVSDESALNRIKEINNKLSGKRMTALELANLMTGLGLDRETAARTAVNGRSPKNNRYNDNLSEYTGEMQEISANDLDKVKAPFVDQASADRMREISGMSYYVDNIRRQWLSMEGHTLISSLNSKEYKRMENAFHDYISAYNNVISGRTPDGKHKRSDPAQLSEADYKILRDLEKDLESAGKAYHDAKVAQKKGGFNKHKTAHARDRDAMAMLFSSFSKDARDPSNGADIKEKNGKVKTASLNDYINEERRLNKKARERLTARVERHNTDAAKSKQKDGRSR